MILVSSCLLGQCTKYNGGHNLHPFFEKERQHILPVCPETMGGLSAPRPPAEIIGGSGKDVIDGRAAIRLKTGEDVTGAFLEGAKRVLSLAQKHQARFAVLKESSPSCGAHTIYDGTFSGMKVPGEGAATALLRAHGITVYSEKDLTEELWQTMTEAEQER
ncbi:MAG: DUF523 domain-containing protein [Selenomonadales bacterium]|nr:DUF523 domain-containing protein [Selenomonadales bacterium]